MLGSSHRAAISLQFRPRRSMWIVGQVHATSGHDGHTILHRERSRQDRRAASAFGGSTTCTVKDVLLYGDAKGVSACSNHLTVPPFCPRRSMWLVGHVHATGGHDRHTFLHRRSLRQDQGAASAFGGSTTCTATAKGVSACSNHLTVPPFCPRRSMWLVGHVRATGAHN